MNTTQIIGNVTRDCESRVTQTGINVCSFTVAVNGKRKDDETIYFKVTAWRKLAENCSNYVKKGMKVYVSGKIDKPKPYTTSNGETRCDLCLTADDVEFLTRVNDNSEHSQQKSEPEPQYADVSMDIGDELPF